MVTGATARVLLLENVYGLSTGKATQDVDFAVMVENWDSYDSIVDGICSNPDFRRDPKQHQRIHGPGNTWLDLIPFGGVELRDRTISWPPEYDFTMSVRGFREAYADSIAILVNDRLQVPVVSPVGLLLLKLFAWRDRHVSSPGKDAPDIAYILRHFARIESEERLFDEHLEVLEIVDYDIDLAAAHVLGSRIVSVASNLDCEEVVRLLDEEVRRGTDSTLIFQLADKLNESSERTLQWVENLVAGLRGAL